MEEITTERENEKLEDLKALKSQRSKNRVFGLLVVIATLLSAMFIYEIVLAIIQ